MSLLKSFLILISLSIAMGCASTEPRFESSKFEFQFEDETYEIIGLVSSDGESLNDLVLRDDREIVFWARDDNQDGVMDRVIRGEISLDRANEIYRAGIRLADEQGKFQQKPHPRTFEFVEDQYIYTLVSVMGDTENSYNLFSVFNVETKVEVKMRDSNQNGQLDEDQFEFEEYIQWQRLYENALQKGQDEGRIQQTEEGDYIVLIDRRLTSQ